MTDSDIPKVHPPPPPPYTPYPEPYPPGFHQQGQPPYGPPPPAPGFIPIQPNYGATNVVIQPPAEIIVLGPPVCPVCRTGTLEHEYSCLGLFFAIFFFPVGIICCLALREQRCTNCRTSF